MILTDMHIHLRDTEDNVIDNVERVVKSCKEKKLSVIGMGEHNDHFDLGVKNKLEEIKKHKFDLDNLKLFTFTEESIDEKGNIASDKHGSKIDVDYIIASVHHTGRLAHKDLDYYIKLIIKMYSAAVYNNRVNVIGHPLVDRKAINKQELKRGWTFSLIGKDWLEYLLRHLILSGKAIEFNRKAMVDSKDEMFIWFWKKIIESKVKISVGSDAHVARKAGNVDGIFNFLIDCGLTEEGIYIPR